MKNVLLGINNLAGYDLPFDEHMKIIRNAGFDAVFTNWKPSCPVDDWAHSIRNAGLIYQSIHAPFGRIQGIGKISALWEDPGEAGEAYTDLLIRCVADAARVRVPLVIIHPYIGFENHSPSELGLSRYARLIDAAEKLGVKLGFENVEGEEYLAAIMERFGDREVVGFCWDTGHEMCYNFSQDMMAKYGKKLFGTHFNDNLGMADPNTVTFMDDLHLLPFDGIADWKGIMDRIKRDGYEGILTFELTIDNKPDKHTHDEYAKWTPAKFYSEAYARAQKILSFT